MLLNEKVDEALKFITKKSKLRPDTAVILGSGLGKLADAMEDAEVIPYADIPFWPHSTAPGHAGMLLLGRCGGHSVAMMQGRVHYYEGYSMEEVTFPVRVLGTLGVKTLVATNASGGINRDMPAGSIMAITDHINYMGMNPLIGANNDEWGPRFPDMTHAYDPGLLSLLERAAAEENIKLCHGVYIAFSGPSYETPAEIRMARAMGADAVGMSTVPEVTVANHMGMKVCGVSGISNYAAGITGEKLTGEEVLTAMAKISNCLCRLLERFIKEASI